MTRADLVGSISKSTGLKRDQTEEVIKLFMDGIKKEVKSGGTINFKGFGTFKKKDRKARVGLNPKTKEKINIPAKTVFGFKASKEALA
jgi:DNA-binding protein HU-beta